MVLSGFGPYLAAQLRDRFDIVGFDPRGVGGSRPIRCFATVEERDRLLLPLPFFPYRRAQQRPYFDALQRFTRACLEREPAMARSMSTADVARDLDLLRAAVGDTRLSYLGYSYGSYLGTTYANLFPGRVRALVIDGVLDPRLYSSYRQIDSNRVATQAVFREFLRLCDGAGVDCAFGAPGGSAARWQRLAARLRAAPLHLPGDSRYGYDLLIADATFAMYDPEAWEGPGGWAVFFDAVADIALADAGAGSSRSGAAAADRIAALRRGLLGRLGAGAGSPPGRQPEYYDNSWDAYYGSRCGDARFPRTFAEFRRVGAYAEAGSRFGPLWWWSDAACASWPVASDRYAGPWTARTAAPVLVVGNRFDPATDYAGARAAARLLPRARLLGYAGWGHVAYHRNLCTRRYVNAYLLGGALPPAGTVCPANPNPFQGVEAVDAAAARARIGLPPPWLAGRAGRLSRAE